MKFFKSIQLNILFVSVFLFMLFMAVSSYSKESGVPKKIMFLVSTETFGGKGVHHMYKEMKKVGHSVKIVIVPHPNIPGGVDTQFINKFDPQDVIYPCGKYASYSNINTKCEISELKNYQPDFVFTQNPYENFQGYISEPFTIANLYESFKGTETKIMYIVYGPHIFHQKNIEDTELMSFINTVFVDSESTKSIFINNYKFPNNRVVVAGYQPYYEIRNDNTQKDSSVKTILWLPRWELSFKNRDLYEGGSTFLNYYHFFYNYASQHPENHFIIRPHVTLFTYAVGKNYLSQNDMDYILNKFNSLKNVTISTHAFRPLLEDIMISDIVLGDATSSLAEVVVADKPIIYLSNGWNNEFNSNALSKELKKYIYFAYEPNDIVNHIEFIKQNNYLPYHEDNNGRNRLKKMLDPIENPAAFIAEYLLKL
ncbi:MAG: hypothetical protein ACIPMY_01525 [Rickettsia endosymbiont of Pentastiridius leporinus]